MSPGGSVLKESATRSSTGPLERGWRESGVSADEEQLLVVQVLAFGRDTPQTTADILANVRWWLSFIELRTNF